MSVNEIKKQIAETIRLYHHRGWSPATSTNYSFKENNGTIWVSRSGVDKSQFSENDFITVDHLGNPTGEYIGVKPSAETLIHCVIYDLFPETKVILHSHSVFPVLISAVYNDGIEFTGYEVQKGFAGETTHDSTVRIPIFDNTQDMNSFAAVMKQEVAKMNSHSFIIRKHGTYAWGTSIFEAKRHLETLEYLCQMEVELTHIQKSNF